VTVGAATAINNRITAIQSSVMVGLGIDLGGDGVRRMTQPTVTLARTSCKTSGHHGASTDGAQSPSGNLNSTPDNDFTVDFLCQPGVQHSWQWRGATYIGSLPTFHTDSRRVMRHEL